MKLNDKRNGKIDRFSDVWESPLRADIIAVSGREPVIQNLVIERVELGLDGLPVVVKLSGLRQYTLRIASTGETKKELNRGFFLDEVVRDHESIVKLTIPENEA